MVIILLLSIEILQDGKIESCSMAKNISIFWRSAENKFTLSFLKRKEENKGFALA